MKTFIASAILIFWLTVTFYTHHNEAAPIEPRTSEATDVSDMPTDKDTIEETQGFDDEIDDIKENSNNKHSFGESSESKEVDSASSEKDHKIAKRAVVDNSVVDTVNSSAEESITQDPNGESDESKEDSDSSDSKSQESKGSISFEENRQIAKRGTRGGKRSDKKRRMKGNGHSESDESGSDESESDESESDESESDESGGRKSKSREKSHSPSSGSHEDLFTDDPITTQTVFNPEIPAGDPGITNNGDVPPNGDNPNTGAPPEIPAIVQ